MLLFTQINGKIIIAIIAIIYCAEIFTILYLTVELLSLNRRFRSWCSRVE